MEMIMCLSLHIKREAAPQLSVWDANREMFYGLRHPEESEGGVMAEYTTPSLWSRHLAHSLHLCLLFCDSNWAEGDIYGNILLWVCYTKFESGHQHSRINKVCKVSIQM